MQRKALQALCQLHKSGKRSETMQKQDDSTVLNDLARQAAMLLANKEGAWTLEWSDSGVTLKKNGDTIKSYSSPVKLGTVLNFIVRDGARPSAESLPETLNIGPYAFWPRKSLLSQAGQADIILTDKERDMLAALWVAPERTLTRDALLQAVWAYAEGVETHTLETHIYRLRQKMESDPAAPQWLVNENGAYCLKT